MRLFLAVPEPHARPRGNRAVPNLPFPGYAGTRTGLRRIGPDSCAWPERTPAVIRLSSKEITNELPSAAEPQTQRQRGSTAASNSGDNYTGPNVSPGMGRVSKSALARAADCVARSLPGQDGYPKGPGARSITAGSRWRIRGETTLCYAPVSGGIPPETAWLLLSGRLNRPDGSPASRFTFVSRPGRTAQAAAARARHAGACRDPPVATCRDGSPWPRPPSIGGLGSPHGGRASVGSA